MNVTKEQFYSFSHAELLEYTLKLREDGYVYPYATSWYDMPEEMREMVINEIDPATTFRFKQCSKLCAEEARRSKNSMYKIELNYTEKGTHICFHLTDDYPNCPNFRYTFIESESNKCKTTTICHEKINIDDWSQSDYFDFMRKLENGEDYDEDYINTLTKEKWRIMENGDMESVIVKYLEKFLEEYKYSLYSFIHRAYNVEAEILNMKHLRNLQHIEFVNFDVLENNLMTFEQIAKCKAKIYLPETKFTFDQIIQLSAHDIDIRAKDLTNEQIKRYLKMWENGEVDENIGDLTIDTEKLNILEEEYYTEGLLTVFERDEPARKRQRSSSIHSFSLVKGPEQCIISIFLSDYNIQINRYI